MLVALAGTQIYSWTRPFPDNAGDRLAEAAQWTTFFTFLAALLILLDVDADNSFNRKVFGVLLITITFMPLLIGFVVATYEWYHVEPDEGRSVAGQGEGSPKSPVDPGAPPQEGNSDQEQPATPKLYRRRTLEFLM